MGNPSLNWFLGALAVEFWVAAWVWYLAPEIRAWWQGRRRRSSRL